MSAIRSTPAVILFAHGSRVEEANQGVHDLAQQIQDIGSYSYVRAAFLECAEPDLSAAVAEAVGKGSRRVVVIPYFLTLGLHLRRDFPKLLAAEKAKYPQVEIESDQPLEGHPL